MSLGNHTRNRSDRVASFRLPPGSFERTWRTLRRSDVSLRVLVCFLTTLVLWGITESWMPQLGYRTGDIPARDIVARVGFRVPDEARREEQIAQARQSVEHVYRHDPQPLAEIRQDLKGKIFQLLDSRHDFPNVQALWAEFLPADGTVPEIEEQRTQFETFLGQLENDRDLDSFDQQITAALADFERIGLLKKLDRHEGRKTEIRIYRGDDPTQSSRVPVPEVLIPDVTVRTKLLEKLKQQLGNAVLAEHLFGWLSKHLPETLHFDGPATDIAKREAVQRVPPAFREYSADDVIAKRGSILTSVELLNAEHRRYIGELGNWWRFYFGIARWGLFASLFLVCAAYIYFRGPRKILEWKHFLSALTLVVITVLIAYWGVRISQAEIIPCLLLAMTLVIVYQQEVALVVSASLALAVTLCHGQGLPEYVTMLTTIATALLLLRRIRTRTRLIYIGLAAGTMAFMTTFGVQISLGASHLQGLLEKACWQGMYASLAGLLITALLPFIEQWFDVQTDLSLLELGDVSHPLLQELLRRAPGTYNHSINVASLAEAAADSIGANGLLVRVGAYYHDIGKMMKPAYFVENQLGSRNRHDTLPPTMSTLVIIAHVKDGADLARKNHLPVAITDFIQQHHGTTLVEYFYRQATNQLDETDPYAVEVDEGSYRYPGPKPQTREAAVLMLSDAVESAARSLQDPGPSRIESLVDQLAMNRLMDGQFDDCGLTLQELRTVQESLTKSLSAVYHGRIKYSDAQPA
ncbi:MAG: HDIG domain-containing protein [Planctomycetota bacterium]|nr:HDIG domain-containing protein [Planctomycetota bacterium]